MNLKKLKNKFIEKTPFFKTTKYTICVNKWVEKTVANDGTITYAVSCRIPGALLINKNVVSDEWLYLDQNEIDVRFPRIGWHAALTYDNIISIEFKNKKYMDWFSKYIDTFILSMCEKYKK